MSDWHLKTFAPPSSVLNFTTISEFVVGEQSYEKGVICLSGGGVRSYRLADRESEWDFVCVVMAEKDSSKFYQVNMKFPNNMPFSTECFCVAANYINTRCKHAAAALLGLVLLRDQFKDVEMPDWFKTKSRLRLWNPGTITHKKMFGDWTMASIVQSMNSQLPEKIDNKTVTLVDHKAIVVSRKKKHCWCNSSDPREGFIQCDSCNNWYHLECVKSHGRPEFDHKDFRDKQFICIDCVDLKKRQRKKTPLNNGEPSLKKTKK